VATPFKRCGPSPVVDRKERRGAQSTGYPDAVTSVIHRVFQVDSQRVLFLPQERQRTSARDTFSTRFAPPFTQAQRGSQRNAVQSRVPVLHSLYSGAMNLSRYLLLCHLASLALLSLSYSPKGRIHNRSADPTNYTSIPKGDYSPAWQDC
jgi:hypothetical protein